MLGWEVFPRLLHLGPLRGSPRRRSPGVAGLRPHPSLPPWMAVGLVRLFGELPLPYKGVTSGVNGG